MTRYAMRFALTAALALGLNVTQPAPGLACACADVYLRPDVVFIGRVVAVIDVPWLSERLWTTHRFTGDNVALFAVELMWQGEARPLFAVVGGQSDCALSFETNRTYLIDGRRGPFGLIAADVCGGSREMDVAIPAEQ